jgi:Arc/MetJ family transcription regulator
MAPPRYILCISLVYGWCGVTKRLIDLDDELLAAAQLQLQTSGVSDTVRAALRHAAAAAARARQVEWLGEGGLAELAKKEQRDAVWR